MNGFVIKYNDIYNLLWEYKDKLEGLIKKIEACENSISSFIESQEFQGEAATSIKNYLSDIHMTMLSGFKAAAQNLLDNIALYKAGYYEIDESTNFVLPQEVIQEFREKLRNNCMDTAECTKEVTRIVSGIRDISSVSQPDTNSVYDVHDRMERELMKLLDDIQSHEDQTVSRIENSAEVLINNLQTCINKIGTEWTDISHYEAGSFYTDTDASRMSLVSDAVSRNHEDYQETYDNIWNHEQKLKDAAQERKTQGVWKTIGGSMMAVSGVLCIALTGGAATPVVAAGCILFGASDIAEGVQDIYYGDIGDIDSTAANMIKDDLFQGNEKAYYFTENIFGFAAAAANPLSKAATAGNLTFKSGTMIVAREALSMAAGEAASQVTMDMTGNRTLSMAAGMLGSGVTAHGLNKIDQKSFKSNNISEYNKVVKDTAVKADIELSADTVNIPPVDENKSKRMCSQLGDIEGGRGEEYSSFLKNGIKESFTPIELEGIQKAKEQGALNKVDYNEIYSLREKDYFRRKSLDEMKFKDDGDAAGGGSESGLNSNLLNELANSGVKYNPEDIVAITKTADGKLVWLENGTDTAGLNHIITEHSDDFLNKGITQEQIPDYVMNALENGKIVGYQGRGTGRPIYEFTYNGEIHKVAITIGNNGFIVGANPK